MKTKTILNILFIGTFLAIVFTMGWSRHYHATKAAMAPVQTFQVQGQIRQVELVEKTIRIAHEEIPNYMPAMTMPFTVKDAGLLDGLSAGDAVQFELSVTSGDSWISRIEKIAPETAVQMTSAKTVESPEADLARVETGEMVPDFKLIDQNGQPIQLSAFRGKAVVLTFIYTRCPLPNFCPLMSSKFSELQKRLSKELPGRYQLLSVSIDPRYDQPAILKEYATHWGADERYWSFATGSEEQVAFVAKLVSLVHERENGLISHDLRTALIGPDGRLVHVWKSNTWTPYEVQRRINELFTGKDYAVAR